MKAQPPNWHPSWVTMYYMWQ